MKLTHAELDSEKHNLQDEIERIDREIQSSFYILRKIEVTY
ncbi:hypothetical protein [Pseudoalteromonas distincta]|nr:hypothetical protein [Pseudoalteromonas distincta]|tara:strand:- start:12013 stop:12135 length:123 start_codon:yes stop_codon:yes gene_type:complete